MYFQNHIIGVRIKEREVSKFSLFLCNKLS